MKNRKAILLIISTLMLASAGCGDGMTAQEREAANQQTEVNDLVGIPIEGIEESGAEGSGEQGPVSYTHLTLPTKA